jgi:hypothetical protein
LESSAGGKCDGERSEGIDSGGGDGGSGGVGGGGESGDGSESWLGELLLVSFSFFLFLKRRQKGPSKLEGRTTNNYKRASKRKQGW